MLITPGLCVMCFWSRWMSTPGRIIDMYVYVVYVRFRPRRLRDVPTAAARRSEFRRYMCQGTSMWSHFVRQCGH